MLSMDGEAAGGLLVRQVRLGGERPICGNKISIYRDARGSAWNIPPLLTLTGDRKSKEKCKHNREESKSSNMFCVVKEMIYGRGNLGIISKDGKCSQKRRLKNLCPRII